MPVLKVSRIFGVPRQTLRDRVKNVVSIDCVTTGRTPVFTLEEEGYIVNQVHGEPWLWIYEAGSCGYWNQICGKLGKAETHRPFNIAMVFWFRE